MAIKNDSVAGMNLYQKLAAIRKGVEVIQKNASGYGYNYVSEDEIMSKLSVYLDKYNVMLVPKIVPGTMQVVPYSYTKTKTLKNGTRYDEQVNEMMSQAEMIYTWVNTDNPDEQIDIPWYLVGQQSDASQCFGSGLTYCHRYFLLKFFGIATPNDDADAFRSKQKATAAAEDAEIASSIITQIDEYIRLYLASHEDKKKDVMAVCKKYEKNGNYKAIKSAALAAKLLEELAEKFK